LRSINRRLVPICPGMKLKKPILSTVFDGANSTNTCALQLLIGGKDRRRSSWRLPARDEARIENMETLTRTQFGVRADVGIISAGNPKRGKRLLEFGKRVAEECMAYADDGYREFHIVPTKKEPSQGKCKSINTIGSTTIVIHSKPGIFEDGVGAAKLRRDGDQWIAETGRRFESSRGCGSQGVMATCYDLTGKIILRWTFRDDGDRLKGTLAITDTSYPFVNDAESNCHLSAEFEGTSVRQ